MNITEILIAVGIVAVIALIIGIILGIAEKVFHVDVNEKEEAIREALPGSNCGGCGFAGCDAMAAAIANGEAKSTGCPVGGMPVAEKIASILGEEVGDIQKMVAYVKCDGHSAKRKTDYNYVGIDSCTYAAMMPGSGPYSCKFGCLGYGTCAKVCPQSAIRIIDKKAVVDESLCVACGKCIKACPHSLIELVPADSHYRVQCNSHVKGKDVREACTSGCISCKVCEKKCPTGAIQVIDNVARIDYSKCDNFGICAKECPRKIIKNY